MEEPTVVCTNCDRPIPESKSFLHEAYCLRNIIRCPKCNDPVDKNEIEEHENEMHKLTSCKYCKKDMESKLISEHEGGCTKKPRMCQFCNCEVGGEEYSNHVYQCGSRTKKCPFCNKNILVRDYENHEPVCEIEQSTKPTYAENFPKISEERKSDAPTNAHSYQKINSKYVPENTQNPYEALSQHKSRNKEPIESTNASKPISTSTKLVSSKQEASHQDKLYPKDTSTESSNKIPGGMSYSQATSHKPSVPKESSHQKPGILDQRPRIDSNHQQNDTQSRITDYLRSNQQGVQGTSYLKHESSASNKPRNENIGLSRPTDLPTSSHSKNSQYEHSKIESKNIPSSYPKYGVASNNDYLNNKLPGSNKTELASGYKPDTLPHSKYDAGNYLKKTSPTDNNRYDVPIYHQANTLEKNPVDVASKKPTSYISGYSKPETKPTSHQDLYNKKSAPQYEKTSILARPTKDDKPYGLSKVLHEDHKTGVTNDPIKKNLDYFRREEEPKQSSKPANLINSNYPTSHKAPSSHDIKSKELPKDYFKRESIPTSTSQKNPTSIPSHSTSHNRPQPNDNRLNKKPSHNIHEEKYHPSTLTRNAQAGLDPYNDQFEVDPSEDPEIQRIIQESLKSQKKSTQENRHQDSRHDHRNDYKIRNDFQEDFTHMGEGVDAELQRAIQESFKASGQAGRRNQGMGDTINDEDFRRIIERSKHEK